MIGSIGTADLLRRIRLPEDRRELWLRTLPPGQARALLALVGRPHDPTYREAAAAAGIGVGTLTTHLRRIRRRHPAIWREAMNLRRAQLEYRRRLVCIFARQRRGLRPRRGRPRAMVATRGPAAPSPTKANTP